MVGDLTSFAHNCAQAFRKGGSREINLRIIATATRLRAALFSTFGRSHPVQLNLDTDVSTSSSFTTSTSFGRDRQGAHCERDFILVGDDDEISFLRKSYSKVGRVKIMIFLYFDIPEN